MTCLSLQSLAPKNGRTAKTLKCLAHGLKHSTFCRETAHGLAKPAKCGKCLIYRCYLCSVFTPSSDFLNSTLGKKDEDSLAKPNLKSKKPHERILQTCGIAGACGNWSSVKQVTRSKPFLSRNLFTACPCWRELASNTANI